MKKFFLALFILLASTDAAATTWWLRPSGGTTGNCTTARGTTDPNAYLRTFAALNLCSSPALVGGDTIKLKGGTYTEFMASGGFTIPAGSAGTRTIIEAVGTEVVTFTGLSGVGDGATFDFRSAHSYITLQGDTQARNFKIDLSGYSSCEEGILILGTANNLTFRGMDISNCVGNGISVFGTVGNNIIEYSRIHHNGGVQTGTEQAHGIYLSTSNNIVRFTEIDNNSGYGLHNYDSAGTSTGNVFENLNIHHNGTTEGAGAILSGIGTILRNSIIWNGTGKRAIQVYNASTNVEITGVTLSNNAQRELDIMPSATGTKVRNTVIRNTIGSDLVLDPSGSSTFTTNHCTAVDTGCTTTGDPEFEDPDNGNFRLKPTSSIKTGATNYGGAYLFDYYSVARTGISKGAVEFVTDPTPTELLAEISCDNVVTDSSGKGNNGTLTGGATYGTGKYNNECKFDGVNDYVNIPHSASLNLSQFTMSAWVNLTTVDATDRLLMGKLGSFGLFVTSSNPSCLSGIRSFFIDAAAGVQSACYILPITAAISVFVAASYDGDSLHIYYNGALATSQSVGGTIQTNTNPFTIGGRSGGDFLLGGIDNVRLYNYARNGTTGSGTCPTAGGKKSEILCDMDTPINPVTIPPTTYLKLGASATGLKLGPSTTALKLGAQ